MKKRNNSKTTWLATAVAAALTLCCTTVSAQPTTHTDAATTSKTSHEEVAWDFPRYFSSEDGTVYRFYEIYDVEDGSTLNPSSVCREPSKGIMAEVIDETVEKPFYVQRYENMSKGDTEGTFSFNGEEYQYNLVSPERLRREHREMMEKTIVHILPTDPTKIAYFDYSKDGRLMVNDLVLLNRQLAATPMNSVTNCDWVMYDQMSKDDFFDIINRAQRFGVTQLYVYYGDKAPQDVVTTTTTTNTVTTTTTTEYTETVWNVNVVAGKSVDNTAMCYDVKTTTDEEGKVKYVIPSKETIEADSEFELGEERIVEDNTFISQLISIPEKLGVDPDDYKLVVSKYPIYYSWISADLSDWGVSNMVYQICPKEDLEKFKNIYADGVDVGNGLTIIDTQERINYIMWCPGSWINYQPWIESNEKMIVNDQYTDLVMNAGDKDSYFYGDFEYEIQCYFSLIPKDLSQLSFGCGVVAES